MRLSSLFRSLRLRPTPVVESEDDTGWTRGSIHTSRLLDPERDDLNREALLRSAHLAYRNNPLAYAIVEQTTSFVLGGGARVVAQHPRVQKLVDAFWHDPENQMPLRIYSLHTELSLFGEQFIRFYVQPLTGRVALRQLDPLYLTQIDTDPEDAETPLRYLYQPPGSLLGVPRGEAPGRAEGSEPFPPARGSGGAQRPPESPFSGTWIPATEILHITINKISSSLRGRSDLSPILPWLTHYSSWLEDRLLQNKHRAALLWDVTLKQARPEELARLRATHSHPPDAGSVLFHSDNETWKAVTPDVGAAGASPDGRAIRLMIATGALLPEHYLGEGGNANRATAAEMGLPAIKRFQRRQELFRAVLAQIVDRVLDEAIKAGRLGPRANRTFSIQFEELSASPLPDLAASIERLTRSLATAQKEGWVTEEEARRLWWRYHAQADESAPQSGPQSGPPSP